MIKTYDQFIEEGLFSKKNKEVKKADFQKEYQEMVDKCMQYIIDFVSSHDGKIDVEPTDVLVYGGDKPQFKNGGVVVKVESVKVEKNEDSPYSWNGGLITVTTKDGKDFPIDVETVPYDTIIAISYMINEAK
jgi:hypothetical protein